VPNPHQKIANFS